MRERYKVGFTAGLLGALILIVLMGILQLAGMGPPGFVNIYNAVLGPASTAVAWIVGAVLFALSGGIWGLLFTALVRDPTVGKGMLFGLLPSLWLWLVVAPVIGQPVFFGFQVRNLIMPIIFNVLIWGSFVGWYCRSRLLLSAPTVPPAPPH